MHDLTVPFPLTDLSNLSIELSGITKNFDIATDKLIHVKNRNVVVVAFFISKYWFVKIGIANAMKKANDKVYPRVLYIP